MSMRVLFSLVCLCVATRSNADWTVRCDQTLEQCRSNSALFRRLGMVPVYIKMNVRNGTVLFDEIWEPGSASVAWDIRVRLSAAEFATLDAQLRSQGYARYCHATCQVDRVTYHSAVWRKGTLGLPREIRIDENTEAHKQSAASLNALGYVPVYVKGNSQGSRIRLDQIWEKKPVPVVWDMRSVLSDKDFALHRKRIIGQGYRQVWHVRYPVGRISLNAAVWYK